MNTEITIEFTKECPREILEELENNGFVVFEYIPIMNRYHEMNMDDIKCRCKATYRCFYNGEEDPDNLLSSQIKNHPTRRYMRVELKNEN